MDVDVIKSLQSRLADLTYILYVMGKEFELIIEKSDDEKVKTDLRKATTALQDSNSEVIKLYHEVKSHESGIQNEWYNEEADIKKLQHEVDNLSKSIDVLVKGNRDFLNNLSR